MPKELVYQNEILINADVSVVWDALVNPEKTMLYMFGCKAESDWRIGSPLLWRGANDSLVYVTGKIVEYEPKKVLAYSSTSPGSPETLPNAEHLIAKYELHPSETGTLLQITQGDFNKVVNGQARYEETVKSWSMVLEQFKTLFQ